MNAALNDYRRIWAVTTTWRDPRSVKVMTRFSQALVLVVAAIAVFGLARNRVDPVLLLRLLAGIGAFWLSVLWAMLYLPGSILLNSAANARLVPRQHRRLVQMAAGGWLLLTAALGFAIGSWEAVPLVGAGILGMALARTGNQPAVVLLLVASNWPWLSQRLPAALVGALSGPTGLAVVTALLLVAVVYGMHALYPAGGDAHLDRRERQLKRMKRFETNDVTGAVEEGGVLNRARMRMYGAALRRACRHPRPDTMLVHALGPALHWSVWIGSLATLVLVGLGVRAALTWWGNPTLQLMVEGVRGAGLSALAIAVLFSTAVCGQQIRRTRGEQALLRLTPLAGDPALLNRRLAGQLLKGTLLNMALLTAGILLATLLISADAAALERQAALCCLAAQVALMGLLGDYAGSGGWNPSLALRAALLAAVEALVALGFGWASRTSSWAWLAAIAIVLAVYQVRRSWNAMLAAPPAFPAHRME